MSSRYCVGGGTTLAPPFRLYVDPTRPRRHGLPLDMNRQRLHLHVEDSIPRGIRSAGARNEGNLPTVHKTRTAPHIAPCPDPRLGQGQRAERRIAD